MTTTPNHALVARLMQTTAHRLYIGMVLALVLSIGLFICMLLAIPAGATLWADREWAQEAIRSADTPEILRDKFEFAVSSVSSSQHIWKMLLMTFMAANLGVIIFFTWSVFSLRRLKRRRIDDNAT